jgi:hypothetical protein
VTPRWLRNHAETYAPPWRRPRRPTVSSVIVGARNEERLRQNLGAIDWTLTPDQILRLDRASAVTAPYPYAPYRRQEGFTRRNPPIEQALARTR